MLGTELRDSFANSNEANMAHVVAVDWDGRERRVEDRRAIEDHEARLRLLERAIYQMGVRMDRSEQTLDAIKSSVSRLQQDMANHIDMMHKHIDLAFRTHELAEAKMQKGMLIQAVKATAGGIVLLLTAIGSVSWGVAQHLLNGGGL